VNSILADHFADVGFRKIIGDNRYLGLVKNIVILLPFLDFSNHLYRFYQF
jgi:hypothetical protein